MPWLALSNADQVSAAVCKCKCGDGRSRGTAEFENDVLAAGGWGGCRAEFNVVVAGYFETLDD